MKKHLKPLLISSAIAIPAAIWGMPARPGIIMAPQPDGTDVAVTLHGDEHSNWVSTPDGYLLARDAAGFLSFARYR